MPLAAPVTTATLPLISIRNPLEAESLTFQEKSMTVRAPTR